MNTYRIAYIDGEGRFGIFIDADTASEALNSFLEENKFKTVVGIERVSSSNPFCRNKPLKILG